MRELRVLTVRQPWAWALIDGGKDVENRTRNVAGRYRGPVAIHASLQDDDGAFYYPSAPLERALRSALSPTPGMTGQGEVLGVVDLVDVHHGDDCHERTYACMCSPWAQFGTFHLVMATPRPLVDPVRARGHLGLWRPDDALAAAIWARVAA